MALDWWLVSRPEIKTAALLRGGAVAISRFGSSSEFIARYALQKIGLTPGKDATIVQIGSPLSRQPLWILVMSKPRFTPQSIRLRLRRRGLIFWPTSPHSVFLSERRRRDDAQADQREARNRRAIREITTGGGASG